MALHEEDRIAQGSFKYLYCNRPSLECGDATAAAHRRDERATCGRSSPTHGQAAIFGLLVSHLEALKPILQESKARAEYECERPFLVRRAWKRARLVWRRKVFFGKWDRPGLTAHSPRAEGSEWATILSTNRRTNRRAGYISKGPAFCLKAHDEPTTGQ